ncbi:MAG: ATP-binding protein [Paracoccaceae bacterium]|nr:ATP-binding protein [Paracoccaceae bacterium]
MTNQQMPMPSSKRQYKMTVAGQLFKHLGLQMYSGAVPAISELISNAYDAMARNVWITIPTGGALTHNDVIVVKDDGHGMNYDECNSLYLSVGRDRRSHENEWTKEYNGLSSRKVQGRKGIGKLAGFGIANLIELRTIKNEHVSHFRMDYGQLTRSSKFTDAEGYEPEPFPDDDISTAESPGTTITLSRLKIQRSINEAQFKKSIARRLLVIDENFSVHINGTPVTRQEIPFQFRFPENVGAWETAELENGQQFQWWAGFCQGTIPEEEQRGFVVYVRGKLAQTPWFFDLSGGVWGQHGMQYLTGEIRADFLDESVDLIATDRGTVRWEDPTAAPLKEWGRKKIRELLETWVGKRRETKIQSPQVSEYLRQAEKLPERERKTFQKIVDRICAIPQLDKDEEGKDIADELVGVVYNALTNRGFLDAIRRLNAASPNDVAQFTKVLSEWDIIELVNTSHLVKGRVEIIRKFKQMIDEKVSEKPDMQNYIRDHPWLIDPKWTALVHEQSLDKLIMEKFGIEKTGGVDGKRRIDFFCLGDKYKTVHIVETKRPGMTIGRDEFDQLRDYVLFLQQRLQRDADEEHRRTTVRGLLIADKIRSEDQIHAQTHQNAGTFDIRTWNNLLTSTETLHAEFLNAVKTRAPADDPRMKSLSSDFFRRRRYTKWESKLKNEHQKPHCDRSFRWMRRTDQGNPRRGIPRCGGGRNRLHRGTDV